MDRFVTLDLNGWLDHLVVGCDSVATGENQAKDGARTLGFRSPLFRQPATGGIDPQREDVGTWLFGAQALAAARYARTDARLVDAIDALALAAGHGQSDPDTRKALPLAVWQLVADCARSFDNQADTAHLALVIPDGRYLGFPRVVGETGRTALETLHLAFSEHRPREQSRSRVELIWRSVAALEAAMTAAPERLGQTAGNVLVINVNRRTFWTVLQLRHWPQGQRTGPLCIARKPVMDDCNEDEAWTAKRVARVHAALKATSNEDADALRRWTRGVEILATGMSSGSLAAFGVEMDALEHWSWPAAAKSWKLLAQRPTIKWSKTRFDLPRRLEARLKEFAEADVGQLLAIVIESPTGVEAVSGFERLVRKVVRAVPIVRVTGRKTAEAATRLASALGRDPTAPAWLDEVPAIDLEVRNTAASDPTRTETAWKPVIAKGNAIPAGETYHTRPDDGRRVTLAPGVEYVHLHLRRGSGDSWDERYSGQETGHTIQPSDHERVVQPLARVRPLSGEARIEIVEHRPDGETEVLAGSRSSVTWSEMRSEAPPEMGSIPELFVFRASETGWQALKPQLDRVVNAGAGQVTPALRDSLYKCTQQQWQQQVFPLSSDGQPPRTLAKDDFLKGQQLLGDATGILLADLTRSVELRKTLKARAANRLHMPLTWLFTGCPEGAIRVLRDAILDRIGAAAATLLAGNDYSLWSIYQGIGRTVRSDEDLKTVFDDLIRGWETSGGSSQDKYLLSAVSHPLARRVSARTVLGASQERFDRVHRFLKRHLENVVQGVWDPRPGGRPQTSLELRYVTMGYRGLCQVRYSHPDWFPADGTETRWAHKALIEAKAKGRHFEKQLIDLTAPYLIGEGTNPTMPGGF